MLERPTAKAGWTRVAFGNVVRLSGERASDPEAAGFERVVGLEHIDPGDLRIRRWADVADGTTFTSVFRPGQVLFGKRRAYQRKVAVADFEGVCSGDIYVLEAANDRLMPELLPFLCQTDAFFEHAVGTSAGSLSPRTNWSSLASFEFLLPPIQEQARLVEVLSASRDYVDRMIAARLALEALRLALTFAYEESLPKECLQTLSGVVSRIEAGKSPKSDGEPAAPGERAVLKVSAVGNWDYVPSENKGIEETDFLASAEVQRGDFLATRANADPDSVARTCIVEGSPPGLMLSDKTWRVVLNDTACVRDMGVLAWTKSRTFRRHIRNQLNGTDAKNISQKAFLAAPFPPIDGAFERLDAQMKELQVQRKSALAREETAKTLNAILVKRAFAQ